MFVKVEPLETNTFCFSLDLELGVGMDHAISRTKRSPEVERKATIKIIDLANKYSIPLNFAVCGHLFLKECKKSPSPHTDMPRPLNPYWYEGDWYKNDPCSNFNKNKSWYAPDIIEKISESEMHEIASHSFSHVVFSDKSCTRKVAEAEIKKCVELAKYFDIKLETFIFPRNKPGHLDLLKKYGFRFYAGEYNTNSFLLSKKGRYLCEFPKPRLENGLVNVPRSFHFVLVDLKNIMKLKTLLFFANRYKAFFHIWCHPYDLDTEKHFRILEKIFKNLKNNEIPVVKIKECEGMIE